MPQITTLEKQMHWHNKHMQKTLDRRLDDVRVPYGRALGFWAAERGIANMAISPLAKAATAPTAKAGEFPPPNS